MKREQLPKVVSMHEQFPFKNSPQSLTFDGEIKRIAEERGETIAEASKKLSKLSGIGERQIYNYRVGKTDIPSGLIPVFCIQFGSNALAKSILGQCGQSAEIEDFDLVKLANRSAQDALGVHQHFLSVFEDGKVTGFELNETKIRTNKAVAVFHRLDQIVEDAYNRRQAA